MNYQRRNRGNPQRTQNSNHNQTYFSNYRYRKEYPTLVNYDGYNIPFSYFAEDVCSLAEQEPFGFYEDFLDFIYDHLYGDAQEIAREIRFKHHLDLLDAFNYYFNRPRRIPEYEEIDRDYQGTPLNDDDDSDEDEIGGITRVLLARTKLTDHTAQVNIIEEIFETSQQMPAENVEYHHIESTYEISHEALQQATVKSVSTNMDQTYTTIEDSHNKSRGSECYEKVYAPDEPIQDADPLVTYESVDQSLNEEMNKKIAKLNTILIKLISQGEIDQSQATIYKDELIQLLKFLPEKEIDQALEQVLGAQKLDHNSGTGKQSRKISDVDLTDNEISTRDGPINKLESKKCTEDEQNLDRSLLDIYNTRMNLTGHDCGDLGTVKANEACTSDHYDYNGIFGGFDDSKFSQTTETESFTSSNGEDDISWVNENQTHQPVDEIEDHTISGNYSEDESSLKNKWPSNDSQETAKLNELQISRINSLKFIDDTDLTDISATDFPPISTKTEFKIHLTPLRRARSRYIPSQADQIYVTVTDFSAIDKDARYVPSQKKSTIQEFDRLTLSNSNFISILSKILPMDQLVVKEGKNGDPIGPILRNSRDPLFIIFCTTTFGYCVVTIIPTILRNFKYRRKSAPKIVSIICLKPV